jgi:hypothetical protein
MSGAGTNDRGIFLTGIYLTFHNLIRWHTGTRPAGEGTMTKNNDAEKYPVERCPFCGSADLTKFDELKDGIGAEDMSERELADYKEGKWGTLICGNCGLSIDYQQ